jgi:hypothetical protein
MATGPLMASIITIIILVALFSRLNKILRLVQRINRQMATKPKEEIGDLSGYSQNELYNFGMMLPSPKKNTTKNVNGGNNTMKKLSIILFALVLMTACEEEEVPKDVYTEVFVLCSSCEVEYKTNLNPYQKAGIGWDQPYRIIADSTIEWIDIYGYTLDENPLTMTVYEDSVLIEEIIQDTIIWKH